MLRFDVHTDGLDNLIPRVNQAVTQADTVLAVQVQKDTSPYVPMLTGSLDMRTRVEGNMVIYPGPYARYLYYGKVMVGQPPKQVTDKDLVFTKDFHPMAQAHWFEASKAQNLPKWLDIYKKAVKRGLDK